MIRCPSCGKENLDSSQFCDECGAPVKSASNQNGTNNAPPNFRPLSDYQAASVTAVGIPLFKEEIAEVRNSSPDLAPEKSSGGKTAVLQIERGAAVGMEFKISADESYIGRWDADNGIFPDVDLDAHDQEAKVSRRHARIIRENNRFLIEDLGSTNGTYINRGRRLIPGNRAPLNDGDEVIVGKTFLRFRIVQ